MARPLQARVAARGFPVFNTGGQSGQGHLPDSTRPGTAGPGEPSGTWTDPNADPASVVTGLAPPAQYTVGGLWGLSGSPNPDRTPRTHAAPFADPTLPLAEYYAEADAAHGISFGGPQERNNIPGVARLRLDHVTAEGGDGSAQQPLSGQIRMMGGLDSVQGYGGGADGPGGVNATMPVSTDQQNYPGELYLGGAYIDPAEVPFLSPDAVQFIARQPDRPAWTGGGYDAPTAASHAQDMVSADIPDQGPAVSQGAPAYALSFWR